jgi:hypothetical protein
MRSCTETMVSKTVTGVYLCDVHERLPAWCTLDQVFHFLVRIFSGKTREKKVTVTTYFFLGGTPWREGTDKRVRIWIRIRTCSKSRIRIRIRTPSSKWVRISDPGSESCLYRNWLIISGSVQSLWQISAGRTQIPLLEKNRVPLLQQISGNVSSSGIYFYIYCKSYIFWWISNMGSAARFI